MKAAADVDVCVHVVVVDSRRLVRDGVRNLLASQLGWPISASAGVPTDTDAQTVFVAGHHDGVLADGAACVDLSGPIDVASLVGAVRRAAEHGTARPPTGDATPPDRPLTPRERSVIRAVSSGSSAAQIANDLGISPRTVERHKQAVMAKLGAPNQARAVARSIELRLLDDR